MAAGRGHWQDGFELLGALGCPLMALPPPQVLRDYLQGKLMASAQAECQLARLAALQHLGRASKSPPSECVSLASTPQHQPEPLLQTPLPLPRPESLH